MKSTFDFLTPGQVNKWPDDFQSLFQDRLELKDTVFGAVSLAESAGHFFRGLYPIESASFWWGKAIRLPWHDQYCDVVLDGKNNKSFQQINIEEEVAQIVLELAKVPYKEGTSDQFEPKTYFSEALSKSDKLTMQGHAVEAMLAIDNFMACLSNENFIEAINWFALANTRIIECCCNAQEIVGSRREQAISAAYIRHSGNREMKSKVFDWCDENMHRFKSMDDAAFDIAGTFIPQKFRAVREWMTDWKKLRSASTP